MMDMETDWQGFSKGDVDYVTEYGDFSAQRYDRLENQVRNMYRMQQHSVQLQSKSANGRPDMTNGHMTNTATVAKPTEQEEAAPEAILGLSGWEQGDTETETALPTSKISEFFMKLLADNQGSAGCIEWTDKEKKIFNLSDPKEVTHRWALQEKKPGLTFDNLIMAVGMDERLVKVEDQPTGFQFCDIPKQEGTADD